MRTILTIIAVFVLAISTGVLSVKAQDANTTLPASFFAASETEVAELVQAVKTLNEENARLREALENFKPCECTCDCGKAKAPPTKLNGWSITMETIANCKACDQVEANDHPRYVRDGWQWKTVRVNQPLAGSIYPRFIVCNGTSCFVIDGMRFTSELDGRVREAIAVLSGRAAQSFGRFLGNW